MSELGGRARRFAAVAWPSFGGAALIEAAVFAFVDPAALHAPGGGELLLAPMTVYSLAFFLFWALVALACATALMLSSSGR